MSLSTFYKNPDLADGFGSTRGRTNPHRGLDIPAREGAPIPSLGAGVVTISEWSDLLGWIVEVRHDDGRHIGYRHMQARALGAGTRVTVGATIGHVGDTGTASRGPHLCTTNAAAQGGVYGLTDRGLTDPWPYIKTAIEGDTMTTPAETAEERYQTTARNLQRALHYDIRERGFGPDWKLGPTIWERLATIERAIKALSEQIKEQPTADIDLDKLAVALIRAAGDGR